MGAAVSVEGVARVVGGQQCPLKALCMSDINKIDVSIEAEAPLGI